MTLARKTYSSGLDYLNSLTLWQGKEKFDLKNIKSVLAHLGNPQNKVPSVIVGGTNGKGSVSSAVASILGAAGKRVGLNTSPHLTRLEERVIIDGLPVNAELIDEAALRVFEASKTVNSPLSFHEAITAAAFLIFAKSELDFAVLEVGVGGRLDASNTVAKPEAVAIVTVDFDHEHVLGNTLAEIAHEKAGIIKSDSPVILGKINSEARRVILEQAEAVGAKSYVCSENYSLKMGSEYSDLELSSGNSIKFRSNLQGEHQHLNMAIAAQIAEVLGCSSEACIKGIGQLYWPARLESAEYEGKELLLDCAHNPAGIRSLKNYLKTRGLSQVNVVFAAIEIKKWREMIEILLPVVSKWHFLTPKSENAVESSTSAKFLSGLGISSKCFGLDYNSLLKEIGESSSTEPWILCGSMYMVGDMRNRIVKRDMHLWRRTITSY